MASSTAFQFLKGETSGHPDHPDGVDLPSETPPQDDDPPSDDESSEDQNEDENDEAGEDEEEEPAPKRDLVSELAEAINKEKSIYCCGGILAVKAGVEALGISETKELSSPPIVIRWDVPGSDQIRKLALGSSTDDSGSLTITDLITDCAPATFAYNGQDVLDPTYRQAVKLDSDQFCSTFNPYKFGIIDAISQALVTGIARATQTLKHTSRKEETHDLAAWA